MRAWKFSELPIHLLKNSLANLLDRQVLSSCVCKLFHLF